MSLTATQQRTLDSLQAMSLYGDGVFGLEYTIFPDPTSGEAWHDIKKDFWYWDDEAVYGLMVQRAKRKVAETESVVSYEILFLPNVPQGPGVEMLLTTRADTPSKSDPCESTFGPDELAVLMEVTK